MKLTRYYPEFIRYAEMAAWQQKYCNLGTKPHASMHFDDNLMKQVTLYDVVNRKYAGFTQILLDMWYPVNQHPYMKKFRPGRKDFIDSFSTVRTRWRLDEWLFVFFVHRLTGSGINYGLSISGYHNSALSHFTDTPNIKSMVKKFRSIKGPKYTSNGYQIASFPKPTSEYRLGGDYFICEILPKLVIEFSKFMRKTKKQSFRFYYDWLSNYNKSVGCRAFAFQYGAVLADVADFFPEFIDLRSHYFYGKNALECLSYLAENDGHLKKIEFYDAIMDKIYDDTGHLPYNAEDITCDAIRWIENYVDPRRDYRHLCLDTIWSSHNITDHPFGRQLPMLKLGLVKTFNGRRHPSDNTVLSEVGWTVDQYVDAVSKMGNRPVNGILIGGRRIRKTTTVKQEIERSKSIVGKNYKPNAKGKPF